VEDKTVSLTEQIYAELMDGLKTGSLDWTAFTAKHRASKGPLYNAVGQFIRDMEPKVRELAAVQAKLGDAGLKLDEAGLTLDELDRRIKEAESGLAPLEETKNALNEGIETLETKLAEKNNLLEHAGELEKLSFDIERLRQLREALTEIGAKSGLKGKEAVAKFFDDLKDYEGVLGAELQLKGLQTQIETKTLEAGNWQAKGETLRRKHDDLKEDIAAVRYLRTRNIKVGQLVVWQRTLNQFETVEQFEGSLARYGDMTKLLNVRKEELAAYQLRLTKAQSQAETLEKERARIEARIDALKVAGVKQLEAMTEATEKQLRAVAASEIKEAQDVAQKIRSEFATFLTQLDSLSEKAVHLGEEIERSKQELQKYERVKDALESHAVAAETEK
jgi:chromosome segregation ATPase